MKRRFRKRAASGTTRCALKSASAHFPRSTASAPCCGCLGASEASLSIRSRSWACRTGVLDELERNLAATSGAVLIVGPAGSGKTTSAYACLRHIVAATGGGRSIASLEDPIEVAVEGVAQTQVNLAAEFDMATGLRSLLRLDPEVIFIGEMRDRPTAEIALQAALTGQLVVTTFHAGDCGDAVNRLIDIGIPTYAVRNAVRLVVAQRLLRRLCTCATAGNVEQDAHALGLDVRQCRMAGACDECHHTGYRGRTLVAEWRTMNDFDPAVQQSDNRGMWRERRGAHRGRNDKPMEVIRVLGLPPCD